MAIFTLLFGFCVCNNSLCTAVQECMHLKVAVTQQYRQALLPSVRHGRTVSVDGNGCVPPAGAITPLVLNDVELLLTQPCGQTRRRRDCKDISAWCARVGFLPQASVQC